MRRLTVEVLDDKESAEGHETPATETRSLTYQGQPVDLDLTAANAKELDELLAPWLSWGTPSDGSRKQGTSWDPQTRAYNTGMREFAKQRGLSYTTPGGGIYYSYKLRKQYAEFLAAQKPKGKP